MADFKEFTREEKVQARQAEERETIVTRNGNQTVEPGSWIVVNDEGYPSVMDDDAFQEAYGDKKDKDDSDGDSRKGPEQTKASQPTARKG